LKVLKLLITMETMNSQTLTVFYDGACPLCQREIAYYQGLDLAGRVNWVDVSATGAVCPDGYCQSDLLKRFHVQSPQGQMYSGAAGFARMWLELPGLWRYVGKVAVWPPVTAMLELAYRVFLPLRPAMQRMAKRNAKD
jgi:predicted DCC family thiol-disulfide oxidoreductase YuxK